VLKPGGTLPMFEHTGSRYFPFRTMLDLMNPVFRNLGPDINRAGWLMFVKQGFR
jgi:hypothetical protein